MRTVGTVGAAVGFNVPTENRLETMESPARGLVDHVEVEIAPETVLPCQLHDDRFGAARLQPEKRLQLAVLADGVQTFLRYAGDDRHRARRRFAEVDDWFASDATDWPFAFVTICDALNLDPGYIRRGLRRRDGRLGAAPLPAAPLRRLSNGLRHQVRLYPKSLRGTA